MHLVVKEKEARKVSIKEKIVISRSHTRDITMETTSSVNTNSALKDAPKANEPGMISARRTAFVARFIVLRESKRSRAHRTIEMMSWDDETSAEELALKFRKVFLDNGDNLEPVDRDLRRALAHASRSLTHFVSEYVARSTKNFIEALTDYERSNALLFGGEDQPKPGGWRMPNELKRVQNKEKI